MKYNIILSDFPWYYNSRNNSKTRFGSGCGGHYDTLKMEEIKALPIKEIVADNCAMFMWCTMPYLDRQIELFKHFGFKYKTCGFTWVKTNPIKNTPFFGVGYYTKSNTELCLLGIRGKMKPISNKISSVVISPKKEHSRKPDEVREKIVELFGDLPRIELFARQKTEGWVSIGKEVTGNDILVDLQKEITGV
jgi:N6-adenosine-specific RNA methylase IME4